MDKPLPDRIRPLEGAGMINLFGNMGYERKRWKWAGPFGCIALAGFLVWVGAKTIGWP